MQKDDVVYGLGETLGALNKRGKIYQFYATDDPLHTPTKRLCMVLILYDLRWRKSFGLFIDYPSEII